MEKIKNNLIFSEIEKDKFLGLKNQILDLIDNIWTREKIDAKEAKEALGRYYNIDIESNKTGKYYLLNDKENNIGITGYYEIDSSKGIFGLRHHGIIEEYRGKGLGKGILNELINKIKEDGYNNFNGIVEMIPKGASDIELVFKKMGFIECNDDERELEKIKIQLENGYYEKAYILKNNNIV